MTQKTDFSGRLQQARAARGITQSELAKSVKCHDREIARYEHGSVKPREARLREIAGALGVSPAWLLFGDYEGTEQPVEHVAEAVA